MSRRLVLVLAVSCTPVGGLARPIDSVCGIRLDAPFRSAMGLSTAVRAGSESYIEAGLTQTGERWHVKLSAGAACPEVRRSGDPEPDLVVSVRSRSRTVRSVSFRPPIGTRIEGEAALSARWGIPTYTSIEHVEWRRNGRLVILSCHAGEACWESHVSIEFRPQR